jgi:hypothetical protein
MLSVVVTATNSSGLSASETISATVAGAPGVTAPTSSQTWTEGKAISLVLPANTFSDPQAQKLTYKAALSNGQALPGWLTFNAATETFSGMAPNTAQTLGITVTATNSSGLSASESFTASVQAPPSTAVKGLILPVQPASAIAAVVPVQSILASSAGSSARSMGFLAGDSAAVVSAPDGITSLAALAADGGRMAPDALFSVPSAAGWLRDVSGTEAGAFGAALFDAAQTPGLLAFHT